MKEFTHLHLHTEYSLLDGVCHIKELIPYLKEKGMTSCAITDHGVMYGAYQFYTVCKEYGMKPIIGCEIYLAKRSHLDRDVQLDRKPFHMTLVARNLQGYKNLMKLVSIAHLEGMYYKPRVDHEMLEKYGEGIIGLSGCLGGQIPRLLMAGKYEQAKKMAAKFQSYFGKEYFFLEIQRTGVKDLEKLNPLLEKLAEETGIPLVATCDSHYIHPDDYVAQEILWCVGDGKRLDDPGRRKYETTEFYVKTPEEMYSLYADKPEYVENTQKVVALIEDYDISFGRVEPVYDPLPDGKNAADFLKDLVYEGAKKRYGSPLPQVVIDRITYELEIIHSKNYDNYFLVVQDYVQWAKSQDIIVGPGRGSGAGTIIAYCLEITDLVDPIYWNLPFERFLNPERPSPPDFDIDFEDVRRDEVVQYMRQKYGESRVSNVAAIGRMKTKAAIRDVARVMGIDLAIADKLSKLIPVHQGKSPSIRESIEEVPEVKELIAQYPDDLGKLVEYVSKVEGTARHVSKHACAIVVTPEDVMEYTPLQRESRNEKSIITQYEGAYIEPLGLLKFDFLGLSNLTQINNTIKLVEKHRGIHLDLSTMPLDDADTYKDVFQTGATLGIFQFESDGMRRYLKSLKPENIFEISFMAAAYRPGPMAYIEPYIECKFGRQEPHYLHPDLIPVLGETYGYPIYQEQVMQISVAMAGYSLGKADILRRVMGKKKLEILMAEKENFVSAVIANGYDAELADKLFEYMIPFAGYGFNKAHSACYALIAYQTAYLKSHFFPEFMAVLLETNLGDFDKVNMINEECKVKHIEILPPDINKSDAKFSIENGNIRFGLCAIKGGSAKGMEELVEKRNEGIYESLEDLCMRTDLSKLTKKTIELLIKSGTMDGFGRRSGLLAVMNEIYDKANNAKKKVDAKQVSLFDDFEDQALHTTFKVQVPDIPESTERLAWEKEILGIYISSHPMLAFSQMAERKSITTIRMLAEMKGKKNVRSIGIISALKRITTKKDGRAMAFGVFEDLTGRVELVIFPNVYEKLKNKLVLDQPVIVKGSVEVKADLEKKEEVMFFLEDIAILDAKFKDKESKKKAKPVDEGAMIVLNLQSDKDLFASLHEVIKIHPGESAVKLLIDTKGKLTELVIKDKVAISENLEAAIAALPGVSYRVEVVA